MPLSGSLRQLCTRGSPAAQITFFRSKFKCAGLELSLTGGTSGLEDFSHLKPRSPSWLLALKDTG